jgi:type I restriction enzyme M protein
VLIPKFNMNLRELLWFASQINLQRWRFFYARMAIKSRLEQLEIRSPPRRQPDNDGPLANQLRGFRDQLNGLAHLS